MKSHLKISFMLLAVGYVTTIGCSEPTGPVRVPISGTVTLDGSPVSRVSVILTPTEPNGLSAVASIENGAFDLPKELGPTPGPLQVRFNPEGAELEEALDAIKAHEQHPFEPVKIPAKYQRNGAFSETVTEEGPNHFAFELHSKFRY